MNFRWFAPRPVRHALELARRVEKSLDAQRDILKPPAIEALERAVEEVRQAARSRAPASALSKAVENLETAANKWLKAYPHASLRENVDVVLVALVVALAIRSFFLQPMAIPTGSMQPTLYGITPDQPTFQADLEIPNPVTRLFHSLFLGIGYYRVTAIEDGIFRGFEAPQTLVPFVRKQRLMVGNRFYTVWFPPDDLESRAAVRPGQPFRAGEDIIRLKAASGDRLFVDCFTYNFRRPKRGEIIIFASTGIPGLVQNTHYIKRLVGLGGERVQIGNDRHVVIDGVRLDASNPRFENVYDFDGPPAINRYSGHVNELVARQHGFGIRLEHFPDGESVFEVRPEHYLAFGDNTLNSHDSRSWGDFPQEKLVGKLSFVFWPFSSRFGWSVR
jgi:signal peptidase I